jgi:hypothetical protein
MPETDSDNVLFLILQNNPVLQGTHNAARRVLDGIHYVSNTIASVGYKPTKMVTNWVTDKIAPPYWIPNSQISVSLCDIKIMFSFLKIFFQKVMYFALMTNEWF